MTQFENFEHDKFVAGSENKSESSAERFLMQSLRDAIASPVVEDDDLSLRLCGETPKTALHRFELISAYIDDELSPTERKQVQNWIDREPQIKTLYTQLLALQGQMQSLEAPTTNRSADEIAEGVFQSLDRRRRQRRLMLGGSAIAASILATFTGLIPGVSPVWRYAQSGSGQNNVDTVMLAVALNKPAINIPKPLNGYNVEQRSLQDRL